MSSTNRSKAREQHKSDYYVTPIPAIESVLDRLTFLNSDMKYLEPCAGGDPNNKMSYVEALSRKFPGVDIDSMDIREDSLAEIKGDYLQADCTGKYDVIITNPPFFIAKEIIQKALNDVKEGGYVIMLLRLNFFGSKDRKHFWETNMPVETYVHHKRISFTKGATDSIEYCHMVWKKGENPEFTKTYII